MIPTLCFCLTLIAAGGILLPPACGDTGAYTLANGFLRISGEGPRLLALECDATGQGAYGPSDLRQFHYPELSATESLSWTREGDGILVTGLQVRRQERIVIGNSHVPDTLAPGHSLGQSFEVKAGTFDSLAIRTPTWHTDTSGATLALRRDGPEGPVIASRGLENVADNSTQELSFAPQPAGVYYVELSGAVGQIGWWSCAADEYAGGTAFVDGAALAGRDRGLVVHTTRPVGPAALRLTLRERDLIIAVELPEGSEPPARAAVADFRWDNTGYDVSAAAVPFKRFFTDNQRYLPAEQFKRTRSPGVSFGSCRWMEADGTGTYDLRFSAEGLGVSWQMQDDGAAFHISSRAVGEGERGQVQTLTLTVLPREDDLPDTWPGFETPDAALTADLNRLWYERAFSYPAPCGPAPWIEWSAIMRLWFAGAQREGEARGLLGTAVNDEGYVHTWGGSPGWPFPDNTRYDTRHFDTNARFILASWRYLAWTHDERFMARQIGRLRRAMDYQLTTLRGAEGLIVAASGDVNGRHKGVGNNYWDILPFGHLDAFANAVYYASLEAMAQIEELAAGLEPGEGAAPREPGFYRALAARVKAAYNETFWDDEKGRYIGCVDIDGKRHDYGFTFVNLEAMAYGLASEQQAGRIYDWMENGVTSSGEADTYSRWVFAPRANTVHNPYWDEAGVEDPKAEGVEPWWHFGWRGTSYDEQCQDGGAILYTSYFDLMARSSLLGADNAWQRWTEILGRYREPDRLCGGPPLYRGEHPQQADPGSVGLDVPFPESGLVPTWFLYGLAGVLPTAEGLHIAPNLPAELPWLLIRNINYRDLTFDLRVTNDEARIVCRQPGYEFTWTQAVAPGRPVVFTHPPAPVPGFPTRAAAQSSWRARWVWVSDDPEMDAKAYLRKGFRVGGAIGAASLVAAADNGATVYVNGQRALWVGNWDRTFAADITALLQEGDNLIAVEAENAGGPGGVLVQARIIAGGKTQVIGTDASWRGAKALQEGWMEVGFDDGGWQAPVELGAPPCDPWGDLPAPGENG